MTASSFQKSFQSDHLQLRRITPVSQRCGNVRFAIKVFRLNRGNATRRRIINSNRNGRAYTLTRRLQRPLGQLFPSGQPRQHARNLHQYSLNKVARNPWTREDARKDEVEAWICGFCFFVMDSYDTRHYKDGLTMAHWRPSPEFAAASEVSKKQPSLVAERPNVFVKLARKFTCVLTTPMMMKRVERYVTIRESPWLTCIVFCSKSP